ncbi:DUF6221 family protein [Streptomyces sp. NPDC060001]|uniref:DUF6221 family protein n=1 Tax=Streptomyces sp. NPDC060001 TaxID=3347032 RepID=UPI0036C37C67
MNAQGENILAFLDAAISLHEERARALGGGPIKVKSYGSGAVQLEGAIHLDGDALHEDEVAHIALNDPESVLRRCAADRKLLGLHQPVPDHGRYSGPECPAECAGEHDEHDGVLVCVSCRDYAGDCLEAPCSTVVVIAEGYGWTEGELHEQPRCGDTKPHPPHTFMRMEVLFQCPGEHGAEDER